MRNYIDHYAIIAKKSYSDGFYFCTGYETLSTLRKKFNKMKEQLSGKPHDRIFLVARDYDKNIIKVYAEG